MTRSEETQNRAISCIAVAPTACWSTSTFVTVPLQVLYGTVGARFLWAFIHL